MRIALQTSRHAVETGDRALTARVVGQARGGAERLGVHSEPVRWEKVLALRAAIACGRYNISSEALADKLLAQLRGDKPAGEHPFDPAKRGE